MKRQEWALKKIVAIFDNLKWMHCSGVGWKEMQRIVPKTRLLFQAFLVFFQRQIVLDGIRLC